MVGLEAVREKEENWKNLFKSLACSQKTNFFGSTCPLSYSLSCTAVQYIFLSLIPGQNSHVWPPFSFRKKSKYLRLHYFASPRPRPLWSSLFLLHLWIFLLTPANFLPPLPKECPCPIKILCSYTIHFYTHIFSFCEICYILSFHGCDFYLTNVEGMSPYLFLYVSKGWS